jgi:hypothetical protein
MIKIGKFVFGNSELILDEFDLMSLMKTLENRNKRLHRKFVKFYQEVLTDENKEFFRQILGSGENGET